MMPNLPPRPIAYLAGPYHDEDRYKMEWRLAMHQMTACKLLQHGITIISPISQWGPVARFYISPESLDSHTFWMEHDLPLVHNCDCLLLLPLDGWTNSRGVAAEIGVAEARHVPILVFEPGKSIPTVGVGDHRKWPHLKLSPSSFYLEAV